MAGQFTITLKNDRKAEVITSEQFVTDVQTPDGESIMDDLDADELFMVSNEAIERIMTRGEE
jgi:hypothetical protein